MFSTGSKFNGLKNNRKPEGFAAKETKEERSVSSSIDGVHSENVKPGENHLLIFMSLPLLILNITVDNVQS